MASFDICGKNFIAKKNLYQHQRIFHGIEPDISNKHILCPEVKCFFSSTTLNQLRSHVLHIHNVAVERVKLEFPTWQDFDEWKSKEEEESVCRFVKHSGDRASVKGNLKRKFQCHRSGIFRSTSKGLREIKSQGSCKIGGHCTAGIEAEESENIHVLYYKTHFGHSNSFGHVTLSATERKLITEKLKQGITFQRVLDDIRDSVPETGINRLHFLTRHDLNNIKVANHLHEGRAHENDAISVDLVIREMGNSVLFYKPQGKSDVTYHLKDDDFVLVVMTESQKHFLLKYGHNVICVDSTHGTNAYDFNTCTVLVIDEFGSGIPVAFMISTHEDTKMLQLYFQCLKREVGVITPNVFMTDDAPAFINAWTLEMGKPDKHLLCSWHIDKNWRENLKKIKGTTEQKALVYKAVRTLLEETETEKFYRLLGSLVERLCSEEETKDFGLYFQKYYANRPEVWAYCFRGSAEINTNMYLESFHRVLKHCYLDGKKNQRLDKLISILLKLVRDKCYERMIKVCKGQISHRLSLSRNRHKRSLSSIWAIENKEDVFYISSGNNSSYMVEKKEPNICNMKCQIICRLCSICYHSYTCTCPDNMIRNIICKHVHAVHMHVRERTPNENIHFQTDNDEFQSMVHAVKKMSNSDILRRNRIQEKAQMLMDFLKTKPLSSEHFKYVEKRLDESLDVFASKSSETFKEPANKNVIQQRRLINIKKRSTRKRSTKVLKPTSNEKSNIEESLLSATNESLLIHTTDDHTYCTQ